MDLKPPILELIATEDGRKIDPVELCADILIVSVSLWSADGKQRILTSPKIPNELSIIVGDLVVSPSLAEDETDTACCFFIFLMRQGLRMPIRKYRVTGRTKRAPLKQPESHSDEVDELAESGEEG
ncbi:hypothetical protein HDU67_002366 [Dinochytrium kinnereticum]|nr:hypothetical protein HDU67_002366 [Dinochytrium kinnereticum]